MILFLILVVGILFFWYRRRNLYRLAAKIYQNERSWPIIGIAHKLLGDTESLMSSLQEFSKITMEHGSVAGGWFVHKLYFIAVNPVEVEHILKTCLEKDKTVVGFIWKLANASIFAPVSIWRPRRKALVPAFSPRIIEDFVDVFAKQSQKLVSKLSSTNGQKFDIWPFLTAFTMDSICETAFGVKLNAQDDSKSPFPIAVTNFFNMTVQRIVRLWMHPDWLFRLLPQYKDYMKTIKFIQDFADKAIQKKKEEHKNNRLSETEINHDYDLQSYRNMTFLDHFIKYSGFTNLELREETLAIAIAGTDTSAVTMSYTLMLLAKYPEVQEKLYEEIYNVFGDSNRLLVKKDLTKLKYLERVIKESMRLFPAVPFIIRKIEKDTKLPTGYVLPADTGVVCSIWGLHRDPKYWGPDAEEFNPDRFLPDRFNLKYPCSFMPFSYGQRNCIGYQYAIMSIKTALSTILREYKIVEDRENGPVPKIRQKFEIMARAVEGYNVALEKRK